MSYPHHRETEKLEVRWRGCVLCGLPWTQKEIFFKSAPTIPEVGETITGATSGATGVVKEVSVLSRDDSGYNGTIVLTDVSKDFTDGETITGSVTGSMTCHYYAEKKYGITYPETVLATFEGKEYCLRHYRALTKKIYDRQVINLNDDQYR